MNLIPDTIESRPKSNNLEGVYLELAVYLGPGSNLNGVYCVCSLLGPLSRDFVEGLHLYAYTVYVYTYTYIMYIYIYIFMHR